MSQGPPPKFKQQAEKQKQSIESEKPMDDVSEDREDRPKRDPHGLAKIARLGVPAPPSHDFELPHSNILSGTVRQRISTLVQSIMRPSFLSIIRSTNFFDIRSEQYFPDLKDDQGRCRQNVHMGEIYTTYPVGVDSYTGHQTPGHAWIILTQGGVWQWHFIHPMCETETAPTFLLSLENYLMYIHLRCEQPLPRSIFNTEEFRGWAHKTYEDE